MRWIMELMISTLRVVMPQSSRESEKHWREEERNYSIISTLPPDETRENAYTANTVIHVRQASISVW